jgi:RluA family pseudouridine synthase
MMAFYGLIGFMFEIIYQDKQILVVNKPAPLAVIHEGWDQNTPTLNALLEKQFGGKKLWVVHRLDKGTTGVIVFARTAEAHRHLNTQFERHEVEKIYHAIVEGEPEWDEYSAQHALHANVGRKHRTVADRVRGKPSQTDLRVIKRWFDYSLLEARPKTGRTHQVRVHCAEMGHPLVGDTLYGAEPSESIARPALHAQSLSFTHPKSGQKMTFTAPNPEDISELIDLLEES